MSSTPDNSKPANNQQSNHILTNEQEEKDKRFVEELSKYFRDNGKTNFKNPIIYGKELNLHQLYKEVISRGGFNVVNETKQWKDIINALHIVANNNCGSFILKNHYMRYLLDYERSMESSTYKYPSGNIYNPNMMNNRLSQGNIQPNNFQNFNPNQPTAAAEQKFLGKKIIRPDADLNFFFRNPMNRPLYNKDKSFAKTIRVSSAILDMKRVELAFESHITSEIYWAINTLLLFSSNNNITIHIENQPYLMESIANYIYYLVNNISDLCFIIDIIQGKYVELHQKLMDKYKLNKNVSLSSQVSASSFGSGSFKRSNVNYTATRSRESQPRISAKDGSIVKQPGSDSLVFTGVQSENKGNFEFMDQTSNTLSLPTLIKKEKDLEQINKNKVLNLDTKCYNDKEGLDNINIDIEDTQKYEEMTEIELNEILSSMIQIMKNLSFTTSNESSIFHSIKFMNVLYLLFIYSNSNEIVSNTLDIITNLSCHLKLNECPYSSLLLHKLYTCLTSEQRDMAEQALECFRRLTLPSGNDEYFDKMPNEFINEFVNLLISPKIDIRDSALEVLYCLSDQKIPTKTRLGKADNCISRLVALICSNTNDNSRMAKFAACVLSKLAEIPAVLKLIMPYEQELFAAACTDETITKVILSIISN